MKRHHTRQRRGASMIEAAISIVVVGIMSVAALKVVGSSARSRYVVASQKEGANLARQLLTEISQSLYEEPDGAEKLGVDKGEDSKRRGEWDDVDDYNKWNNKTPSLKDNTAIIGSDGWTREVLVEYVELADPWGDTINNDDGVKRVTVTVTSPGGVVTELRTLRVRAHGIRPTRFLMQSYTSWVGVELQVGSESSNRLVSGATRFNQVPE